MLEQEINAAQRQVRTDAYQMSIGEVVTMYEENEIVIAPEFQRLFRWNITQKSRLVESLLLGIPLPPIFVFENEDGKWELIDGLQRLSTILEFMGKLKDPESENLVPPSLLESTKYLPSLHNSVWECSENIPDATIAEQNPLSKPHQLAIRRARIGVEILKRPSDTQTKFDLFQRLNAGGTQANAQELRNCIMLMVNAEYFRGIKAAAERQSFLSLVNTSEDQMERQRHMELAVRFLVHSLVDYDGSLDVEEYIDSGIVDLAHLGETATDVNLLNQVFDLLQQALGDDALRRFDAASNRHIGKVGLVGLEGIAVGIAHNLPLIQQEPDPIAYVRQRTQEFWSQAEVSTFTAGGLRGTTRIQRTVPFGTRWFRP
ncbi:DUF262 domain-containing protein [Bordetella petrii]|uniref:DUF262 domain-containing protein n=1 Tax=Bordetella petrii TaxID=94624 RepID=UPI0037327CEF